MPSLSVRIGVIGLGNWGTALANHLSLIGHDVLGWCIEPEIKASINAEHKNCRYLQYVSLCPSLKATNNLSDVLDRAFIVVAFPSSILGEMAPRLTVKPETVVVSAIKG